jgi:hypothetical protein
MVAGAYSRDRLEPAFRSGPALAQHLVARRDLPDLGARPSPSVRLRVPQLGVASGNSLSRASRVFRRPVGDRQVARSGSGRLYPRHSGCPFSIVINGRLGCLPAGDSERNRGRRPIRGGDRCSSRGPMGRPRSFRASFSCRPHSCPYHGPGPLPAANRPGRIGPEARQCGGCLARACDGATAFFRAAAPARRDSSSGPLPSSVV